MADLSAVVNQLRQNNDDARYGNLQLNQNVEESRKENSAGLQKLSESIIKNTASILKDVTVPIVKNAEQEKKDREEAALKKVETDKEGNVLLFANLAKQNQGLIKAFTGFTGLFQKNKGKEKADENRENRFMNSFKTGILNLNKKFNGFVKGIADSAKQKGKNVLDILKKFAMVGALGALVAFLDSDMFKNMKEKYIDPLTESFGNLFASFGKIGDGIDKLKSNFFNEETGEFQFIEGLKKSFEDIKNLFSDIGLALAVVTGLVFRKKILAAAGRAVSGMTSMLGRMTFFNDQVADTNKKMKDKVDKSKKSGVFRKGIGGILGRFGRLFGKVGLVGLAITGAVDLMGVDLKNTKVFSKVGDAFKSLFSVVGDFTKSLLGIKKAASADLKKTVADADPDAKKKAPKRPEEIRREKQLQAQNDAELKKKQADNLKKARAARKKAQMDLFKKADAESMKAFKASQKATKEAVEKVAKEGAKDTAEIVAKSGAKALFKKIPIISIGAGLIFGVQRALQGDFTGAGLEVISGVAGTVPVAGTAISAGADATLLAKDLGAFEKKYPIDGVITPNMTANNGGGIDPIASRTGSAPVVVNNVNNSKVVSDNSQQTNNVTPIDDRGLHPSMLLVQ